MFYFNWLQKNNPTGKPDRFPELKNKFETSVPGLYCIGDLTGIPLIKLAAESGHQCMEKLAKDESFKKDRESASANVYDLIIIGAGPAGVSASLRALELGFSHLVIESSRTFNTIFNFPAGKPIYVTPQNPPMNSALKFNDGSKETLLAELAKDIENKQLPIREGETAQSIVQGDQTFTVQTTKGSYTAKRVVVAIGKTGNARTLGVPGETLPKVFTRLIDPGEFIDNDILVVGGGDSALEAAIALANAGNRVTLSYRKSALSRPKEQNLLTFDHLVESGNIVPVFESSVKDIRDREVLIRDAEGERTIPNHVVFALIGTEIPIEFFRRSKIRIEGEKHFSDWVKMIALVLFALVLYFGKDAPNTPVSTIGEFFLVPAKSIGMAWRQMLSALLAWGSFTGIILCSAYLVYHFVKERKRYFTSSWNTFKYCYYFSMLALFSSLYAAYKLLLLHPLFGYMGYWYSAAYTLTIVIFGLRRIVAKPTGYIKRQTLSLIAFQTLPLFILPMFVLPFLGSHGMLPAWITNAVFPGQSYWRAFGFILAWPLFIHTLATGQPVLFWFILGIVQTFVIIPYIVFRWGKGAYCGWICSCGGLAETLGDEYRSNAPHGPLAKKWDNAGQVVLWIAIAVTILAIAAGGSGSPLSNTASDVYAFVVDTIFAGVIGVGAYFFMSGRVWCRFLCPLAALMHIYARFSVYRIFANKKRCISCNICTKVCHMGIDVMNYANKGIPMNDVECVRCSACVVSCPMQVLTFGKTKKEDYDNVMYKQYRTPLTQGWQSGLPQKDIDMLVALEKDAK